MEDRNCCSICFENFTMPKLLKCTHTFCLHCLLDFLRQEELVKSKKLKEHSSDQEQLRKTEGISCPLCRIVCPNLARGTQELCTNYFVKIAKPKRTCEMCWKLLVEKYCSICNKYTCKICYRVHKHIGKWTVANPGPDVNEPESKEPRLPLHLSFGIHVKTICFGILIKEFKLDVPTNDEGIRGINTVIAAKPDGAYVLPQTVPFILKFNQSGALLDKIRTPEPCMCITEMNNCDILGIFRQSSLILRYSPIFRGWAYFTTTSEFVPFALAELSDGRVVIVGTDRFPLEAGGDTIGVVNVYSNAGVHITRLESTNRDNSFKRPYLCVCNKRYKTFAIYDDGRQTVTIYDENLIELAHYKGPLTQYPTNFLKLLYAPLGNFFAVEMCCSSKGEFFISCRDGTLHILNHNGKLSMIAIGDCSDGFGMFTDVAVDVFNNVWCSNSEKGAIKIFNISNFKNNLMYH